MAKRGCEPRSMRATERPRRFAIMASREPLKPEPITATSKSVFTNGALNARQDALRKVHLVQTLPALLETSCTLRKQLEVPQIGEDAFAVQTQAVIQYFLERGEEWR